jgi:thiol-disulfide isomerase/thioredoxin
MTDVPLISDQPAPGADAEQAARPEWQRLALTDVRTGQTFTFADFAGSTVFVHPMATWCTNCRVSQRNLQGAVMPELQGENVVFISIDVQTALSDAELLTYTQNEGFDWRFAVATPELITALVQVFGLSIGNPPSQPHFIIRPDGTTTALLLGNPPPDETLQRIRAESGA